MASWEYMDSANEEWLKGERDRAKNSVGDKEVGLLGQAEAMKDYNKYNKKLGEEHK